jgi:hypothetical protein
MKALSVTKGGNTEDRLCGVFAIMEAMLSVEKNYRTPKNLGTAKMIF